MDEEQIEIDKEKKKMKKAEINDNIEDIDIDEFKDDFENIDKGIEYTFVPNIKDEQKKQEEIMED